MTNVTGEDRSSFQAIGGWGGDTFGFAKATEGTTWSDLTFASNWSNLKAAGKVRGAYHFFHPALPAVGQAQHFMQTVRAHGLQAGDILVADVEITIGDDGMESHGTARSSARSHTGLHPAWVPGLSAESVGPAALEFLNEVKALAGPGCQVVLYTDLFMAQALLGACAAYPLFIAYYESAPIAPAPWRSWTFWQNGHVAAGGGDTDYFNGDEAALRAWASPAPKPLPADWTYLPVQKLTAAGGDTSVKLEWGSPPERPGYAPMPAVAEYEIAVAAGPSLAGPDITSYPRYVARDANPETWQGGSLARKAQYTAGVRALAADGHHAGDWATATFSTT
jgi:lysozyme